MHTVFPGSSAGSLPEAGAVPPEDFAPRSAVHLAADAPAACSDLSDRQLLAVTDTASLTADQLDRRHHLLRHSLPDEQRGESVLVHFEAATVHEAVKMIKKMSQRDLQAKFKMVYGAKTFSNNNNWLRRKLFEAIGVDPAKGAVKKAAGSGGSGGRRRRGGAVRAAAVQRIPRATRAVVPRRHATAGPTVAYYWADDYAAQDADEACEALLALGEAAASLEQQSCSEASALSQSMEATAPSPSYEMAVASTSAVAAGVKEEEQVVPGGSAAFRRLLLEQHGPGSATLIGGEADMPRQAYGPSTTVEYMALLQHAAAAAAVTAGTASFMPAMPHAHVLGGLGAAGPGVAPYGMSMLPLFQPPVLQHSMMSALRHVIASHQHPAW